MKNKVSNRKTTKVKRENVDNITRFPPSSKEGFISHSSNLPDIITLPDGRTFTNQEIVSIKKIYQLGHNVENDILWELIQTQLAADKHTVPQHQVTQTEPKDKGRTSVVIKKKG